MKTLIWIGFIVLFIKGNVKAQVTHTITEEGYNFVPAQLYVNVGDTVEFKGSDAHSVLEVSQETWNTNGTTPLEGGFSFPSGSGTVSFDAPGTHYYVCTIHVASYGMKGIIVVGTVDAIKTVSSSGFFAVYPVPLTGDAFTIRFKNPVDQKKVNLALYDITGVQRLSLHRLAGSEMTIDLSSVPKGIYLLQLSADGKKSTVKIVRE